MWRALRVLNNEIRDYYKIGAMHLASLKLTYYFCTSLARIGKLKVLVLAILIAAITDRKNSSRKKSTLVKYILINVYLILKK